MDRPLTLEDAWFAREVRDSVRRWPPEARQAEAAKLPPERQKLVAQALKCTRTIERVDHIVLARTLDMLSSLDGKERIAAFNRLPPELRNAVTAVIFAKALGETCKPVKRATPAPAPAAPPSADPFDDGGVPPNYDERIDGPLPAARRRR